MPPLSGSCAVRVAGVSYDLDGRPDVFLAVTDYLYLPLGTAATITSAGGGRLAIPTARATGRLEVSYRPASDVQVVGTRGAGNCSRQINNYAPGNALETDHLLVCEVLTPGGNWPSYPPHKHDEHSEAERELEEIYTFDIRRGPDGPGLALHRTCGNGRTPDRSLRGGPCRRRGPDPHGFHGPSMAGPAADGTWLMTDDLAHHWICATWDSPAVDPRLPMTGPATTKDAL